MGSATKNGTAKRLIDVVHTPDRLRRSSASQASAANVTSNLHPTSLFRSANVSRADLSRAYRREAAIGGGDDDLNESTRTYYFSFPRRFHQERHRAHFGSLSAITRGINPAANTSATSLVVHRSKANATVKVATKVCVFSLFKCVPRTSLGLFRRNPLSVERIL